jgi:hypothetical protein
MAGVAGELGFAGEEFAVVFTDHGDHGAGNILLGICVTGEIWLTSFTRRVAAGAFHAERGDECAHHGTYFFIRENLEVLMGLGRSLFLACGGLGEEGDGDQKGEESSHSHMILRNQKPLLEQIRESPWALAIQSTERGLPAFGETAGFAEVAEVAFFHTPTIPAEV